MNRTSGTTLGRRWAAAGRLCLLAAALALAAAGAIRAQEPECVECHDVDPAALEQTVHGFLGCVDCHPGADEPSHPDEVAATGRVAACADCHEETVTELEDSIHRASLGEGLVALEACSECHGPVHALVPADDPASPVHPMRLAQTCGACHANPEMAGRFRFHLVQPLAAYAASVHAQALEEGLDGADCSACHGSHAIQPAADPRSTVNHRKVVGTCAQCHGEIAEVYSASIHGIAAAEGVRESPVCTDCHGEHRILSPRERGSPVYATNVAKMTCERCHGDLRLADKYGLAADKVPAFRDSYHGLATRAGSTTVANCASCHGVHDIQPSSDPSSHVHKDNLSQTCGQCHRGAGARFSIGPVHVLPTQPEHAAVYWVRLVYLWLIWLTIGGMVLHNGLDFLRKLRSDIPRFSEPRPDTPERMSRAFRWTHALFAGSFIVLAYTGFALKYPDAWWAEPILRWEGSFALRGWIHRAAAVVMVATGLAHVVHLVVDRRARACVARMRPSRSDLHELRERVRYFFGRRETPPPSEWVDYAEKAEYLAVIWGTVVMAVTGFALWLETPLLRWLPSWVADVATVVHFYEAVLATLAILVWHLYSVVFDPVVYPMDKAWLTGRSAPGRTWMRRPPDAGAAEKEA